MSNHPLQDSGERRATETGAVRDRATGKGRYDLLPTDAIALLAKHFENGALKYADRNWEKGMPLSWYVDSGLRHAFKGLAGQTDEPHFVAAAWNFMCLIQTMVWIEEGKLPAELNDLPAAPDAAALKAAAAWFEKNATTESRSASDANFLAKLPICFTTSKGGTKYVAIVDGEGVMVSWVGEDKRPQSMGYSAEEVENNIRSDVWIQVSCDCGTPECLGCSQLI